MVIAFVGSKGIPYNSNLDRKEYNLELIAKELNRRNHSVYVLSNPNYTNLDSYQGVNIIYSKDNSWSKFQTIRKIKNLDILHILSIKDIYIAIWVSIFMPKVRIILDYNDYTFNKNSNIEFQKILLKTYLSKFLVDEIITDKLDTYNLLSKIIKSKVSLVRKAIPYHINSNSDNDWKIQNKKYILVNSYSKKNQLNLKLIIESYKKIKSDYPLIVMGSVISRIKTNYSSNKIIFIGDVSGKSERDLISNAKYFIESSSGKEDQFRLYTALINAVPVLVSRNLNNNSLIKQNGLYFVDNNLSSIFNMLKFMEGVYHLMTIRAINFAPKARELFTLDGQINKYIFIYVNAFRSKFRSKVQEEKSIPISIS